MLNKRLSESKRSINISYSYEELVNVCGGDNSMEHQHQVNMKKDIKQLEICIKALKEYESKDLQG